MKITKQEVQAVADLKAGYTLGHADVAILNELARIALASLEAEVVAYIRAAHNPDGFCFADGIHPAHRHQKLPLSTLQDGCYWTVTPLYTAPTAPVSVPGNSAITQHFDTIALDTAREIMCDVNRRHEFLGGEVQLLSRIQCRIDDACRAAMLQGADGALTNEGTIPANTPCKEAPEHIWLQTAGVWPENGEFSELTWCSDNQHEDDTLYVRADVVTGNSPVVPDWQAKAERLAELHGSSFVVFRNGESPQCADPTKVIISFTDEGLGHGSAAPQQEVTQALTKGMERYGDAMQELAKKEVK